MTAKLFCKFGKLKGTAFEIDREASIGRSKENQIVIPENSVSSLHAKIVYEPIERHYYLEDLGSLNGTRIDGIPVVGRERLDHLNLITFVGELNFIFQDMGLCRDRGTGVRRSEKAAAPIPEPVPQAEEPEETEQPGRKTLYQKDHVALPAALMGKKSQKAQKPEEEEITVDIHRQTYMERVNVVLPKNLANLQKQSSEKSEQQAPPASNTDPVEEGASFVLEILNLGGNKPMRFPLSEGENLIGRTSDAGIVIQNSEISRKHAVLTVREGRVFVRDEGSTNKTFLGRTIVDSELPVAPDDIIWFGKVKSQLRVVKGE